MDIRLWLQDLGLEEYAATFHENGVDAALLPDLTNEDLKDLGLARLADRKRLLKAIEQLSLGTQPLTDTNTNTGTVPASPTFPTKPAPSIASAPNMSHGEGERRQVSVIFIDLAGFTELSTRLDPEDLHALLTRFYEITDGAIERYDGTVDKHLGDGVMGLFGAPRAHDDDPLRAVRTAFDIHAAMAGLSAEFNRPLNVHVGIACGEVIAGALGGDGNKEYTVLGDSVNLASRLDSLAEVGETMIDAMVHRAVSTQVACDLMGDIPIKGIDKPVQVWRAKALQDQKIDQGRGMFVGRRGEFRQFESVLQSCVEDQAGQSVLLRGEAGIGKTRLVEEFIKASIDKGFTAHKGLILEFGVGKGQDAIGMLMASLMSVMGGDDPERAAAIDTAIMEGCIDSSQQVFLNDILDLPQPGNLNSLYEAMDNTTRHQGRLHVVADLIKARANHQPILLIIEDIHSADTLILDQVAMITQTVCHVPAIMIMTSRIEGDPIDKAWRTTTRNSPLMTIDLSPLKESESLELADEFMGNDPQYLQRCIERADGNPLFLEQLLRNAKEETVNESVPPSIQSLVLARVDRLQAIDKEALQAAAIIGQRFDITTLRHLINNENYDCSTLIDHQLIRPEATMLLFSHAMIQEGVYTSLLKKRRQALHLKTAEIFAGTDPILKAEHLGRADDPTAPRAFLDAAIIQIGTFHFDRALRLLDRGLELATQQNDIFNLTCTKGSVLNDLSRIDQSIDAYNTALEMAADDIERCRAWLGLSAGLRISDRYAEALEILSKAEGAAVEHNLINERARIHHLRGNIYFPMGRIEECTTEHKKSLDFARQGNSPEAETNALSGVADANYVSGRMNTAYEYFKRCAEAAAENGFGNIEIANLTMKGFSRFFNHQIMEAFEDASYCVSKAEKTGFQRGKMLGELLYTTLEFESLNFSKANDHCENLLELTKLLGAPRFEALGLILQVRNDYERDKPAQIISRLEKAYEICENVGFGFCGPRVMGSFARFRGDESAKLDALSRGEELLKEGAVSHNHFWFYPDAIDVSLQLGNWDEADRYASALEDFTTPEPLKWSTFYTARGRALASFGRNGQGGRSEPLATSLQTLIDEAEGASIMLAIPALKNALEGF